MILSTRRQTVNDRGHASPAGRVRVAYYPPTSNALRRVLRREADPAVRQMIVVLLGGAAAGVGR